MSPGEKPRPELNISALVDAIAQLDDALEYAASQSVEVDPRFALHMRAAAIQAFEFTYELTHKMLRRYLETVDPSPDASAAMDFGDLVRAGFAQGLLGEEIAVWREFRRDRGTTSHAYDGAKAQRVFERIPRFLREAKHLRDRLAERLAT